MTLSRRRFLITAGLASGGLLLGGCTREMGRGSGIGPNDAAITTAEAARRSPNAAVRRFDLTARPAEVDLGGIRAATWAYDDQVPGPELRLRAGEVLQVPLRNDLADPTTIHFHGIAMRNDMDGVPDVTQPAIDPGDSFTYEFVVPHPGTYFYHPHVGMQLDRGLYAPLIVDDPDEPGDYDQELVIVLDDWTDGVGRSPDELLDELLDEGMSMMGDDGMGMGDNGGGGMMMGGGGGGPLGADTGDVTYPLYLLNGRVPDAPRTFDGRPGQRVRLRIINAGSDTAFRVALGSHRLRVTHTDGFPVDPVEVDTLVIGMGERYDAVVTLGDGAFPLVAEAEGKDDLAFAVVRTGSGPAPRPGDRPAELDGRLLTLDDLRAEDTVSLPARDPDRTHRLVLSGDMGSYRWTINGEVFEDTVPLEVASDEHVRLEFVNRSMMFHPMHLHGHTFQVTGAGGQAGARKDTVNVLPMETVTVDFQADNPGQWLVHCHNQYHAEAGMMGLFSYQR